MAMLNYQRVITWSFPHLYTFIVLDNMFSHVVEKLHTLQWEKW